MTETRKNKIELGRADLAAWEQSKPSNYFAADANFQRVLQLHLKEAYGPIAARLEVTGEQAARADELARVCNRDENLPRLERFDSVGQPREEVVFVDAHHELGRTFWRSGVLSVLGQPGHEVESGANAYLLAQNGESGHACPVACTAGLIKLLQTVGSEEQRQRYLPALLTPEYDQRLYASQFITEVQGGSDVGANDCLAVPDPEQPGRYRLSGEKWFCSVMDAPLFVMTARVPGAAAGTPGLGLFLVPRLIEGKPNGFAIRRLKDKLGTRSLATGEAEFAGALGEPIGPIDKGFKNLISIVLDTSRVHNGIGAAAFMRRATNEARSFARQRRAFGQPIAEFPAVQQILARMEVQTQAAVATTFRLLANTDGLALADQDRERRRLARRTQVNINKYWTALACTRVARDGIEILGGNGTIEEFSVLPRLYRDAMVFESWEGTHNTLCAQVLRDFAQRELHRAWLAEVRELHAQLVDPLLAAPSARAAALVTEVERSIGRLLSQGERFAQAHIRVVVDRMWLLQAYLCLLAELQHEQARGVASGKAQLVELFRLLYIDPVDPLETPELAELQAQLSRAG